MNRERVQMLRDMLEGIPEKQMHLDTYYQKNGAPCGTIACIAGWAAIYPPFVKQGFKRRKEAYFGHIPAYKGHEGMCAAAVFFDVSDEVFDSTLPGETGTHKQIALKRLDALLKG